MHGGFTIASRLARLLCCDRRDGTLCFSSFLASLACLSVRDRRRRARSCARCCVSRGCNVARAAAEARGESVVSEEHESSTLQKSITGRVGRGKPRFEETDAESCADVASTPVLDRSAARFRPLVAVAASSSLKHECTRRGQRTAQHNTQRHTGER